MTLASKLLSASGGGVDKLYVDDVFSAFTYSGAGANQTINNGIDLAGKGGLVIFKHRTRSEPFAFFDSERLNAYLMSSGNNATAAQASNSGVTFNSDGFTLTNAGDINNSSYEAGKYISFSLARAKKFFDVITFTTNSGGSINGSLPGNGGVPHNLGIAPGMVIMKPTSTTGDWLVWNRGSGSFNYQLKLNTTASQVDMGHQWMFSNDIGLYAGNNDLVPNATYVAYLFAHDPSADGIVQCGSFTTDGSGNATVDLGWEAQYLMVKTSAVAQDWTIVDTSRGMSMTSAKLLFANLSTTEATSDPSVLHFNPTATGFKVNAYYAFGAPYSGPLIYLAIRRPNKPPTVGTEVYSGVSAIGGSNYDITFNDLTSVDLIISQKNMSTGASYNGSAWNDRLRGFSDNLTGSSYNSPCLVSSSSEIESVGTGDNYLLGVQRNRAVWGGGWSGYKGIFYGLKRAIGVFDEVCYTGGGFVDETFSHSLGTEPEIIITKRRNLSEIWWFELNFTSTGFTQGSLNTTDNLAPVSYPSGFLSRPSKDSFSYTQNNSAKHASGGTYVAYLFASKAGISKVFSYTGNGTSQTINCGFTTGSRFVLIKRTDTLGDWMVSDTKRGIIADSDPRFSLNTTAIEVTSDDWLDPDVTGSGFIVNQTGASNANVSGATYIGLSFS
jgi:hypothetical protein